jgi:hypothetical protein
MSAACDLVSACNLIIVIIANMKKERDIEFKETGDTMKRLDRDREIDIVRTLHNKHC